MVAQDKNKYRGVRQLNLHLSEAYANAHKGMPVISGTDYIPSTLTGWNYARGTATSGAVHFFLDDYQFESIWNTPERYIDKLSTFEAVLTPDFSLFTDMPLPMKIWNIYRSKAIGAFWESVGIKVIPTLQWSDADTFGWAFTGLSGGTVAVSTLGTHRTAETKQLWADGMTEAINAIKPETVLLWGKPHEDFDWQGTTVIEYQDQRLERMKKNGRTRRILTTA